MWNLIIFFIITTSLIVVVYQVLEKKKYQNENYCNNLEQLNKFFDVIDKLNDYVTWKHRDQIKVEFVEISRFFKGKSNYYKKEEKVKKFNDLYKNFDSFIVDYNQNYILSQKEKLKSFFSDIEGKQLDEQQQTALITDEYSNLIIAGAGPGKTLTILSKIKYLIEQKNIKPEDILLLSFTKKTISELNERLQKIGLNAKATTFHKLGYDTIKKYQDKPPGSNQRKHFIQSNQRILKRRYFQRNQSFKSLHCIRSLLYEYPRRK